MRTHFLSSSLYLYIYSMHSTFVVLLRLKIPQVSINCLYSLFVSFSALTLVCLVLSSVHLSAPTFSPFKDPFFTVSFNFVFLAAFCKPWPPIETLLFWSTGWSLWCRHRHWPLKWTATITHLSLSHFPFLSKTYFYIFRDDHFYSRI